MIVGADLNAQLLEIGVLAADDNDYVIHAMPARTKYVKMIRVVAMSPRGCASRHNRPRAD